MARAAFPPSGRSDRRFSDDQIYTILRAAEADGADVADLCAASGVTVPTYCLWKARYGRLTLEELGDARKRESRQAMMQRAGLTAAIVLVAAGAGAALWPGGSPAGDAAAAVHVVRAGAVPHRPAAPEAAPAGFPRTNPQGQAPAPLPTVVDAPEAPVPVPATPPPTGATADERFAVQVAAKPSLQEAGAILRQLEGAGYSAYVLPITVGETELFRVRVGPFESQGEALAMVRRLEGAGYEGAWIAR